MLITYNLLPTMYSNVRGFERSLPERSRLWTLLGACTIKLFTVVLVIS